MRQDSFEGKTVVISGSGNVAIYATEKAVQLGGKVVALSDSNGYIYDKDGVKLDVVKAIKLQRRARISEYVKEVPGTESVSYTHLDVYKRQAYGILGAWRHMRPGAAEDMPGP